MTDFTITIVDPTHLAGISSARAAYNAALPEGHDPSEEIATDADYVHFVMLKAAESYANQYPQG
jgi:CBS domain-containing protein